MPLRSSHPLDRIATIAASDRGRGCLAEGVRPADVLEIGRSIGKFWSVGVKNWSIFKELDHSASALRSASSGGFLPERTTQRLIRWRYWPRLHGERSHRGSSALIAPQLSTVNGRDVPR
jgi:hypothetical protein